MVTSEWMMGHRFFMAGRDDSDRTLERLAMMMASPLRPYVQWEARALPDPRSVTDQEVLATLIEIIEAEGPLPCLLRPRYQSLRRRSRH